MGQSHLPKPSPTQSSHELTQPSQTVSSSSFATPSRYPVSHISLPPIIQQITPPVPPGTRTRISELIDPEEFRTLNEEEEKAARIASKSSLPSSSFSPQSLPPQRMIESPSGKLVSIAEYQARQDRKLSIPERKEAIRKGTQWKIAMEAEEGRREEQNEEGGTKSVLVGLLWRYTCCVRRREIGKGRGD